MKTIELKEEMSNVNIDVTQNRKLLILDTPNEGYTHMTPLEAVELGRALIEEAMQLIDWPESGAIAYDIREWITGKPVEP